MIKLYENWAQILRRAWSVRLMILAGILTGIEAALPVMQPIIDGKVPPGLFAALSGLATAAALVARIVAQQDV